ncbi:MAG TPA: hypothetical protein DHW02_00830 [Ktedonobacter sp.]|nr:hypothetical protein [Ktedonobacter sp.]
MLGNLGSSVMGMVRQVVVTSLGPIIAGPFSAALRPTLTFYDFLVNGSVSGALIPTFNDYSMPEKREEMRRIVYTLVNLIFLITLAVSIVFMFIAPWIMNDFLAAGFTPEGKVLALQYARIIFFSLLALTPFSVLLAAMYALKEFGWPAFATVSYHCGIILGAIVGGLIGERIGHFGIAVGVLIGAAGELVLLLPGIRKQHFWYMFALDVKHPAIRRILKLYAPVAFSFLVSMFLVFLDQYLTSRTPCLSYVNVKTACGEANTTAMIAATTLIQFPVGLVAAALSFAVLPTLATHVREGNSERFKEMLLLGIRLGLLLMIPAAAGLIVLQNPITVLIFRHVNYSSGDAQLTAIALQNMAYQLPFVALDQLLIAAFYARKNTIIPVTVQFASILFYLAVALPFSQTIGMPAMAFANTVQNSSHAVILLIILRMVMGSVKFRSTLPTILKIVVASLAMIGVAWGLQVVLSHIALFSLSHFLGALLTVIVAGGLAAGVYFGLVLVLKVEEVRLLKGVVMSKLGKK